MKIVKYKKNSKGKYIVLLDDGRQLILYEDVILKFDLLLKKEILDSDIKKINDLNLEYEVYYVALNSIKTRFKSIYDLKRFLKKKEYSDNLIDNAVEKLIKQGYLDDRSFTKSYINTQIMTTSHGPIRIINELENKRVDNKIITDEILMFTEDIQIEKIKKIIDKSIKSNRNKGGIVLKQKIINDLKTRGYEFDIISKVIDDYDFSNDSELAKKEYDKLYKKYSSKYKGYELKNKIREKMFQKGLVYEEE